MKKTNVGLALGLFLSLLIASAVMAQGPALTLSLSRDFGYGGFGGDIQGTFSLHASGPSTLTRVDFFIDDNQIGEVTKAPFTLQFVTDNYPLGTHSLSAIGYTSDGSQLPSAKITRIFVSPSAGTQSTVKIVIIILALILGATLLAALVPILTGHRTTSLAPGTPRSYTLGGAICPKCKRPFAMPILGLNLIGRKFTRCPYCGKWSVVGYASMDQLHAAERAEVQSAQAQIPETSAEENLKKNLTI